MTAALLSTLSCAARLLAGPPTFDDAMDCVLALLTTTTLARLLWIVLRQPRHAVAAHARRSRCLAMRVALLCAFATTLCVLGLSVLFGACWELRFIASSPIPSHALTSRGPVANWCVGDARNGSIAVLIGGFMASDVSLAWVQQYVGQMTRTCVLYRSGTGRSAQQPHVSFSDDASDMRAVLDRELDRIGLAEGASPTSPFSDCG